MDRPTAADVLARSEYLRGVFALDPLPDPPPDPLPDSWPGDPANRNLIVLVEDADVWVEQTASRAPLETAVPDNLARVALQAVTLQTELFAIDREADVVEAESTGTGIRSFTAGSYSETRFGYGEYRKAGMLSPSQALSDALWLLMDQDARDEFLAQVAGRPVPESAVVAVDWNRDGRLGPPLNY